MKRQISKDSDKTCGITLDDIKEDDKYMFCNTCKKNFFATYIKQWLNEHSNTCPICRQIWTNFMEYININTSIIYSIDELKNNDKPTLILFYIESNQNICKLISTFEKLNDIKIFNFSNNYVDSIFTYNIHNFPIIRYYNNGTQYHNEYIEFNIVDNCEDTLLDNLIIFKKKNDFKKILI